MEQAMLLYVLCENTAEAHTISQMLLTKRLVACTNVIEKVVSEFFWPPGEKKLSSSKEVLLLAKAIETKWPEIEKEILAIHSYDNPAIAALPLLHVTKKYYDWMMSEINL